jgi:putative endonuclease
MVSENTSAKSFAKKYKVDRLVYYERFDRIRDAISREKEIKGWRREKKNDLMRRTTPKWEDLGQQLFRDRRRGPSLRSG